MSCRVAAFLRERNDGHAFWAGHALLFGVGHKESTRCLCSIALSRLKWESAGPCPHFDRSATPHELETSAEQCKSVCILSICFPSHEQPASRILHMWLG